MKRIALAFEKYEAMATVRDLAGNESRETARILIPAPGATPAPLPVVPQPQTTDTCPLMTDDCSLPAPTAAPQSSFILPTATRSATVSAFQSPTRPSPITNSPITNHQPPAPLFGAAAITAIAAATGLVLAARSRQRFDELNAAARPNAHRREEAMRRACRDEERAQAERVRAEADAKTESLRRQKEQAREQEKLQNYLHSKAALEAMLQNPALSETEKARIREEAKTKGLASAFTLAQTANIDTQPPAITLPQSWHVGRSADYTVADPSAGSGQAGSGLSSVRVVITDQQERYPKVHWDEAPSGATLQSAIAWDGRWADRSQAQPGEYLAWVKAADNAGNESFAVGKIRVEGKNPLSGTGAPTVDLSSFPTATVLPPLPTPPPANPQPTLNVPRLTFNAPSFGGQTASPQVPSQTTRFHSPTNPSPIQNRKSETSNLWWGGAAAGAAGAFLAESLRRKKEREKRLEDYQNRPKIEQEGKGGRLTGKQIAQAYRKALNDFRVEMLKDDLSEAEADEFVKQAKANGSIASVLESVNKYTAHKQAEEQAQAERAAAWLAWRVEETTYTPPPPPTPTPTPTLTPPPDLLAGLQALYEGRKAGEVVVATSTPTVKKTPLPTPTGTPSTETAVSLLKYSPIGQQLYDSLKKEGKVEVKYSDDGAGHMYRDEKQESYLWGLIKTKKVTYTIVVDPRASPTYISGSIAHEIYHHISPGDTQLEEYYAFLVGDVVRSQIVEAGYGQPSDLRFPLTDYNVNTNNPDLGQLIQDLDHWFSVQGMPQYVKPKPDGYGMTPLPTMPTETPMPTQTLTPTQTPTVTQPPSETPTATQTPTSTQKP